MTNLSPLILNSNSNQQTGSPTMRLTLNKELVANLSPNTPNPTAYVASWPPFGFTLSCTVCTDAIYT